jgi:MFS family permease
MDAATTGSNPHDAPANRRRLPATALLVANAVSQLGNAMAFVAIPWFVLETTGSAAQTGLTGFAFFLPNVISGLFGGTLVDRLGPKHSSVLADTIGGLTIAAIPLLYQTVGLAFWQLLVLVFLGTLLDLPGHTACRGLVPELARLGNIRLERFNALYEGNSQLTFLLGPALAGVLIATTGATTVLWIDAATFAVSAVAVAALVPNVGRATRAVGARYVQDLVAGWRFLANERLLLAMSLAIAVGNMFGNAHGAVILPVYAKQVLESSTALGLLLGLSGGAALLGTLAFGVIGGRISWRWMLVAGLLVQPLEYWMQAVAAPVGLIAAAIAAASLAAGPINPLTVTVRHQRIPTELRGRVFAATSAIASMAAPISVVIVGYLTDRLGLRQATLLLAIAAQIAGLVIATRPVLNGVDEHRPRPEARLNEVERPT